MASSPLKTLLSTSAYRKKKSVPKSKSMGKLNDVYNQGGSVRGPFFGAYGEERERVCHRDMIGLFSLAVRFLLAFRPQLTRGAESKMGIEKR